MGAVYARSEPEHDSPHAPLGEAQARLLPWNAQAADRGGVGRVLLGADPAGWHHQGARGGDQGLAGADEPLSESLDRGDLPPGHALRVVEVAAVGHVHDAVGSRRASRQGVQVLHGTGQRCRTERLQPGRRRVRTRQPGDGVARADQLGDDGRAGLAGTAGHEHVHGTSRKSNMD